MLLATGAMISIANQAQGMEDEVEEWMSRFEFGTADIDTDVSLVEPFHKVEASYERIFTFGEYPEEYVFTWNTALDGVHLFREQVTVEAEEDECEYTFNSMHSQRVPDYIPDGAYETKLTVYAVYEDGSEFEVASATDEVEFEGYNEDMYDKSTVDVSTDIKLEEPFHAVQATYTELVTFGESPEEYIFGWETSLDNEELYSDEIKVDAEENKEEYSVSTLHKSVVPEYIPEGEYQTELTVTAVYEDGTEEIVGSGADSIYYEGYNI